jgi:hypothetical protein
VQAAAELARNHPLSPGGGGGGGGAGAADSQCRRRRRPELVLQLIQQQVPELGGVLLLGARAPGADAVPAGRQRRQEGRGVERAPGREQQPAQQPACPGRVHSVIS